MKHPRFSFTRLVRTNSSESYVIWRLTDGADTTDRAGSLDLHFDGKFVHGTLVLEEALDEENMEVLTHLIDHHLITGERDDFIFTVYLGKEIGYYSDSVTEDDRALEVATRADVQEIRSSLSKVLTGHQKARGKLAEHALVSYFESLKYNARRAGPDLDALKIDVVAESEKEIIYAQSKLGSISNSEIRKIVICVASLARTGERKVVAAILARDFPKDCELRRRELEGEFSIPIMCIQSYQVAAAVPEYRQALGV